LSEDKGVGTRDLARIEVAGMSVRDALFAYGPGAVGKTV
jgi:hypothetical protein